MALKSVKVPKEIEPLFEKAESFMSEYFSGLKLEPENGQIHIEDERYILVRADSLAVNFFEFLMNMYPTLDHDEAINSTAKVLFDMGHSIGKSDAKCCFKKNESTDPMEKLSAGPLHFSYSGWAFVEILEESKPSQDDEFYLLYNHPHTFEADSWLQSDKNATKCACHMNAGYSSGWASMAYGMDLISRELLCRAKGDETCRFIMARPHKLEEMIQKYKNENPDLFK